MSSIAASELLTEKDAPRAAQEGTDDRRRAGDESPLEGLGHCHLEPLLLRQQAEDVNDVIDSNGRHDGSN